MSRRTFWRRVKRCKHEWYPDYYVHAGRCGQEEVGCEGPWESHCRKCGVYEITDPCGYAAGQGGWPWARYKKSLQRSR